MTIRKLDAGRGAGWITDGLAIFKAQPGPFLTACLVVGLLSSLPVIGLLFGLVMPVLYAGLLSVLHHQARGEPVATGQIFDGFQQPGAFARLLPIVLLNLAFAFVVVILIAITVGPVVVQMIQAGQSQPDPQMMIALLPKFALLMLVIAPVGIVFGWIMMLAIPRAMLGQVAGMTAVREAASALWANVLPLLVNLLCLMLLMFVIVLIMMIPFMLLGVVQQHSRILGALIQIPVMAVFTGGILAVYCAVMYQAWREVFGDDVAAPPPPPATFAA